MEKINVTFKGMSNVPDEQVAQDGQMAMMMNASIKNGELVQRHLLDKTWNIPNIKQALYHQNSRCWLMLDNDGKLQAYEYGKNEAKYMIKESGVKSFMVMGNIVIMNIENDTVYAIFRGTVFVYLGAVPAPPEMKIKTNSILCTEGIRNGYGEITDLEVSTFHKYSKGLFDNCVNQIYKKGGYIDNAIFVVAVKFFDGTYRYSHWYFVRNEHEETIAIYDHTYNRQYNSNINRDANFLTTVIHAILAGTYLNAYDFANHVLGFYPEFYFDFDLSEWEDIVDSVEVFSSGSIMEHEVITDVTFGELYSKIGVPKLRENIENCSTFYKVAEYDLKGKFKNGITNTSPSDITQQKKLPVENRRGLVTEKQTVFNNMLHVVVEGELKEIATDNVMSKTGYESSIKGSYPSYIEYENGDVIHHTLNKMYNQTNLPYLISQPMKGVVRQEVKVDNGTKLDIKYKNHSVIDVSVALNGSGEYEYWADFSTASNVNNCHFFYNYNDYDTNTVTESRFNPRIDCITFLSTAFDVLGYAEKYQVEIYSTYVVVRAFETFVDLDYKTASDWGILFGEYIANSFISIAVKRKSTLYTIESFVYNIASFELKDEHKTPTAKNILKLSEMDNPFYFPPKKTYQFDGDIVAMASNAEAISQGQFGQFPLFVFTTEGIWAMQVDTTGEMAYSTQTPFSREVCNGAVCALSDGVAFTTDRGVMMITGGRVVNLSQALDAPEAELFEQSEGLVEKIFARADNELTSVENLKPVSIRQYLKDENGVKLAYNYLENELIVSNMAYGFSYVYSFDSQMWSMMQTTFDVVTNSYPELVVLNTNVEGGKMYTFNNSTAKNKFVAITRPMKAGTMTFKRLRQAALRTTFKGTLNFYVLGSNDGANFVCITGKEYPSKNGGEPTDVMRRDLVTSMSRSRQYKYFAIAIAGNMEGRISMAELLMDAGFANNQLR